MRIIAKRDTDPHHRMTDLSGQTFGRLRVLWPTTDRCNGNIIWACRCECGTYANVASRSLKSGYTKSCGCLHKETLRKGREVRHNRNGDNLKDRFLSKIEVSETGCLIWVGAKTVYGYGVFSVGPGQRVYAHRYALQVYLGGLIPEGYHVHHVCETPACVAPTHLMIVTPEQHTAIHRAMDNGVPQIEAIDDILGLDDDDCDDIERAA